MTSGKTVWIAYVGVVLTLLSSLISLKERYRIESRNKAVEMAVELESVEALAASQGLSLPAALESLKGVGVGAAVLSEQKVGELVDEEFLRLVPEYALKERKLGVLPHYRVEVGSEAVATRLLRGLSIRFGSSEETWNRMVPVMLRDESPSLLRSVAVGLDPQLVAIAKQANLRIIARGDNPTGASGPTVKETLKWFKEDGASIFLPQGDQALGRRDNLKALIEGLEETGLLYASPEFAKIGGDLNVLGKAPERVVRLHSAQSAELDKLTSTEAVDRYVRAASERSLRVLLIRPLTLSSEKPFDAFVEFIGTIKKEMEQEGVVPGPAKPFEEPKTPQWVFPLIGLSASLVAVCAASLFFVGKVPLAIFGFLSVGIGLAAFRPEFRPYAALMSAMSFPVAAYGFLEAHRHRVIVLHYLLMAAVCLVGGLAVAGLLNDLPYFIRAEQFPGVKLAHFGPILLVGLFMAMRLIDWRGGLQNPITWLQAILALVLLAALAFMFMRTGNDNPAAVSGFETRLRSLLDNILPVRPRTKEFMIGYPALVVGLGLLMLVRANGPKAESLKGWAVLSLMVGAIALTSVVNTMCHLHTPLNVGLIRIAVGLVVGGIIGGGAWLVLRYAIPRAKA